MAAAEWNMVYRTVNGHEADIIKIKLENEGIKCVILNKQDSMYKQFNVLSALEIHVPSDFTVKAKHIIEQLNFE